MIMSPSNDNFKNNLRHLWLLFLELVQVVVMSLAVFVVVYIFVFQPNKVQGTSMVPNFQHNEFLLTDKVTYRWSRDPLPGDVVVFHSPNNDKDFIKRIIAVPGDSVRVESGQVYINDQLIEELYLPTDVKTSAGVFLREGDTYTIPEGGYFVMGDNRPASSDSREWGPVPAENIVGKAWFRYWPLTKIGLIKELVFAD
jgi:signal peptidase I